MPRVVLKLKVPEVKPPKKPVDEPKQIINPPVFASVFSLGSKEQVKANPVTQANPLTQATAKPQATAKAPAKPQAKAPQATAKPQTTQAKPVTQATVKPQATQAKLVTQTSSNSSTDSSSNSSSNYSTDSSSNSSSNSLPLIPPVNKSIYEVESIDDLNDWIATTYIDYIDEDLEINFNSGGDLIDTIDDSETFGEPFERYLRIKTAGSGQCLMNAFLTILSENYRKIPFDATLDSSGPNVRLKIGTDFRTSILPFFKKADGSLLLDSPRDFQEVCKVNPKTLIGEWVGENIGFQIAHYFGYNLIYLIKTRAQGKNLYDVMPTPETLLIEDKPWIFIYLTGGVHYEAIMTSDGEWEMDWEEGLELATEYGGTDKARERAGISIGTNIKCKYIPGETKVNYNKKEWLVADRDLDDTQNCKAIYLVEEDKYVEYEKIISKSTEEVKAKRTELGIVKILKPFEGVIIEGQEEEEEEEEEEGQEGNEEDRLKTPENKLEEEVKTKKPISLFPLLNINSAKRSKKSINAYVHSDKYDIKTEEPYSSQESMRIYQFVKSRYNDYTLPRPSKIIDPNACAPKDFETYPYQKFIREYIRQESPYRGVLVYHGLGSGKTCTSIAAAEAIYSKHSNNKIIVMTPIALKENFLTEISTCGFKHYRYQNFWTAFKLDPVTETFALNNLELPQSYIKSLKAKSSTQQYVWIPDLSKSDKEANYNDLEEWQKKQIREQIRAFLESKIRFIGYTGLTRKALMKLILDKTFDDSTIIIDEIHNLTRLMVNRLEKYLMVSKSTKKKDRKDTFEPITVDDWVPRYKDDLKVYDRAILFYRLLSTAKNVKIIALSGTPIVNFPTEIGYLCNMLRGYFHTCSITLTTTNKDLITNVNDYCLHHPFIGFYQVDTHQGSSTLFVSLTNWGYKKIFDEKNQLLGLEQLNDDIDEEMMNIEEVYNNLNEHLKKNKIPFKESPKYKALPLFPIDRNEFVDYFISTESISIKNSSTFIRRIAGLISYYKGYKADYMPTVTKDEEIDCPMSSHQQAVYSISRIEELEQKPPKKSRWATMQELEKEASSYRFKSRSNGNFAFPTGIERPYPDKKKDLENEIEGAKLVMGEPSNEDLPEKDLSEEAKEAEAEAEAEEEEEEEEEEEGIKTPDNIPEEEEEEEGIKTPDNIPEEEEEEEGIKTPDNIPEDDEEAQQGGAPKKTPAPAPNKLKIKTPAPAPKTLKIKTPATATATAPAPIQTSKGILLKREPYPIRLEKALKALKALSPTIFQLDPSLPLENQLKNYSSKYYEIYNKIISSKGSSLVYSTFKTVEGLGVFAFALEANGFTEIKLAGSDKNPELDKSTIASLKDRSKDNKRFIIYTGSQTIQQRQLLINIFNMREEKLPSSINTLLKDTGLLATRNQKGEAIRVFMITGAGAEGLSLKNVRTVHIMEPHWNKVRTDQVKGRAVRICSHAELKYDKDPAKNERTVEVFTYLATFSNQKTIDQTIIIDDGGETTDEFIYNLGIRKALLNQEFTNALQSGAIDCQLNQHENNVTCKIYEGEESEFLYDPRIVEDIANEKAYTENVPKIEVEKVKKETRKDIKSKDTAIAYSIESNGVFTVYNIEDQDRKYGKVYDGSLEDLRKKIIEIKHEKKAKAIKP